MVFIIQFLNTIFVIISKFFIVMHLQPYKKRLRKCFKKNIFHRGNIFHVLRLHNIL